MRRTALLNMRLGCAAIVALVIAGCADAHYATVVKPSPKLSVLSPELEGLSDETIDTYLKAEARPAFPTQLAVVKLESARGSYGSGDDFRARLASLGPEEADGWKKLAEAAEGSTAKAVDQVQFISPLLVAKATELKLLRQAAAKLHCPVLLVYVQEDSSASGLNDAAMAYWTIVGLFCVPGHRVGHYTVCQALLIDTRSGFILGTAEGGSKKEEDVLIGAFDIARERVARLACAEAIANLQSNARQCLNGLSQMPATGARASERP